MGDTAVQAQARLIYEQFQADHLAQTALANMGDWVASGSPPSAETLRSQGFVAGGEKNDLFRWTRKTFLREWGYSIPCREAVAALRMLGPMVEVGCGSAYWTALLRNAGLDVIATDAKAGASEFGFKIGRYADVEQLTALEAVRAHPRHSVFCSWPSPGEPWATEAVLALEPGDLAAMVLHETVATTGDAALADVLAVSFESIETVCIPQFPGVPDRLTIYRRL